MGLIISLIIGGFIGWLAAKVAGRDEGVIGSVAIGLIGAVIGSVVSAAVSGMNQSYLTFSWVGIFWAFVGSVILVAILNAIQHKPRHPHTNL